MKNLGILILTIAIMSACGGGGNEGQNTAANSEKLNAAVSANPMDNKGIGPVKKVEVGEINQEMVATGKQIFEEKCTACHKTDQKFIGPAPAGITKRRSPEWIMNMILNPVEMVQKDPIAKQLLMEANGAPMADQNLTEEEARNVLEYFRTLN